MSVKVSNNHGWILDHHANSRVEVVRAVPGSVSDLETEVYRLKSDLFKILSPFVMDSQMTKLMTKSPASTAAEITHKKKRKRKTPLNAGEQLALDYHEEVKSHMKLAYSRLLELARDKGILLATDQAVNNNLAARQASNIGSHFDFVAEAGMNDLQSHSGKIQESVVTNEKSVLHGGVINTLWHHRRDSAMFVTLQSGRYILPPHSSFLMSDIDILMKNYQVLGKFNLIVLDPPWENKSVKRKKKYCYLDNDQLLELPLGGLAASGCLLVVWVTNRCRHIQFVTEELFPRHGIRFLTKWFWLKITCTGEMVCDFDSAHKRPYETLIIGQRALSDSQSPDGHSLDGQSPDSQSPDGQSLDGQSPDGQSPDGQSLDGQSPEGLSPDLSSNCQSPDGHSLDGQSPEGLSSDLSSNSPAGEKTIISVPCSLHSKKPPLYELFQSFLPSKPKCLELFARNLQPHWTSWGNEVLLHQHEDYYEKVP